MKKYLHRILLALLILVLVSCSRTPDPFSFVQICDPQLGMGGYEHDTATLKQAVRQINELDVDFAIFCGDLVNHANDSSYADFKRIITGLSIPYYYVPGNHDVGMIPNDTTLAFYRSKMGEDYFSFYHKGVAFIFTNSQLWKADIGEESRKHDTWFVETIESVKSDERAIVSGHFPIYLKELDEMESYSNFPPEKRMDLLELMRKKNVVAYLSGHKHEVIINDYHGIQLVSGESTSKNFDKRPMGFRKWDVNADTLIHSFIAIYSY
ncbi:MAG: metallophosphoesterase [Bacteroidales bacterium]|nr:metallophosphoesterase [Bacteroidales bacterium]